MRAAALVTALVSQGVQLHGTLQDNTGRGSITAERPVPPRFSKFMRALHLSHLTRDFFVKSINPWIVVISLGPVSFTLFLVRIVVFGWGSTWTWWAMLLPMAVSVVQAGFVLMVWKSGLEGLQDRSPVFGICKAAVVFWSMQLLHTVSVVMYSKFAMYPAMVPLHRLGGHVSTCFAMAAVTFLQKLMLDTACPLPYGPLQLGLPPKAMILLTLVFTSQYMDYATDFLVSYGLCGRVVPLPFTARNCSFNGTQRCQLIQGFCGTFTAASAADLVISMALELVDLSTRTSVIFNAISMVSQIIRLLIGAVMASAAETGGGGSGGERAILLISLLTTVLSFLLSVNTVRDMVMRSAKKLKHLSHRAGKSVRGNRVVPEIDWDEYSKATDTGVQEDHDNQPIAFQGTFAQASHALAAPQEEVLDVAVDEADLGTEQNDAPDASVDEIEQAVDSALDAAVQYAAGEVEQAVEGLEAAANGAALGSKQNNTLDASEDEVEQAVDSALDAAVQYAAGESDLDGKNE